LVEPCVLAGCPEGGRVLDPFAGSGTVGAVCQRLGRRFVGTELSTTYCGLAYARTAQMGLL
jgi:DNA modification methylase